MTIQKTKRSKSTNLKNSDKEINNIKSKNEIDDQNGNKKVKWNKATKKNIIKIQTKI